MRLVARIRVLFTLIVLATYSPLGIAMHRVTDGVDGARPPAEFRGGHLGFSMFTGRYTRLAATRQFDTTQASVSRCPSRYVRRTVADVEFTPSGSANR
jgi:polyisoprenoid-binding protein YceI